MAIDWASFTPWTALIGGVIVGLATAMLVLLNGRVRRHQRHRRRTAAAM
jgi:hypothetical protein